MDTRETEQGTDTDIVKATPFSQALHELSALHADVVRKQTELERLQSQANSCSCALGNAIIAYQKKQLIVQELSLKPLNADTKFKLQREANRDKVQGEAV